MKPLLIEIKWYLYYFYEFFTCIIFVVKYTFVCILAQIVVFEQYYTDVAHGKLYYDHTFVNAEDIELDFNNWDRKITIGDVPINLNVIRDCVEEELTNSLEEKEEEEEND